MKKIHFKTVLSNPLIDHIQYILSKTHLESSSLKESKTHIKNLHKKNNIKIDLDQLIGNNNGYWKDLEMQHLL